MKKMFLRITITCCLVFLFVGFAKSQKLDDFEVTYVYRQLALKPLPKELKTYSAGVSTMNRRIGHVVNKSAPNGKPYEAYEDNSQELIQKYLVIDGLNKVANGSVIITLSFGKYKITDTKYNKSGEITVSTTYSYSFPSNLTVKTGAGLVIYDDFIFDDKYIFSKTLSKDYDGSLYTHDHIVAGAVNLTFNKANQILYDNFATPVIKKEIRMYTGNGKKLDYSDIEKANEIFRFKILNINENTPVSDYQEKINEAISAWKAILKEADYNNDKARVNSEIAAGLLYNISFAYLIINDFENASKSIIELKSLKIDPSKKFKKNIQSLEDFIKSQQERFIANN